jgi:RNA polymerase sigma factor (sigma-70 family)
MAECAMPADATSPLMMDGVMNKIDEAEYGQRFAQAYNWLRYDFAGDLTHHDWEDLAQDSVIRLMSAFIRKLYNPEKGSVNAFFKSIVRNVAIDDFRRRRIPVPTGHNLEEALNRPDLHEDDLGRLVEVVFLQELLKAHGPGIEDLLRNIGLTTAEKIAFKLRVMENKNAPEIGKILGISARSVRSRWFTARRRINDFLERTGIQTP